MSEVDTTMKKVRDSLVQSGLSLHDLGIRMGYPEESARKSAWQFIQKTDDPRISTLRRFAKAMGIPLVTLLAERKNSRLKSSTGSI